MWGVTELKQHVCMFEIKRLKESFFVGGKNVGSVHSYDGVM